MPYYPPNEGGGGGGDIPTPSASGQILTTKDGSTWEPGTSFGVGNLDVETRTGKGSLIKFSEEEVIIASGNGSEEAPSKTHSQIVLGGFGESSLLAYFSDSNNEGTEYSGNYIISSTGMNVETNIWGIDGFVAGTQFNMYPGEMYFQVEHPENSLRFSLYTAGVSVTDPDWNPFIASAPEHLMTKQATVESAITVIQHKGNASTTRPEGAALVHWIGWVEPVNARENDLWTEIEEIFE